MEAGCQRGACVSPLCCWGHSTPSATLEALLQAQAELEGYVLVSRG